MGAEFRRSSMYACINCLKRSSVGAEAGVVTGGAGAGEAGARPGVEAQKGTSEVRGGPLLLVGAPGSAPASSFSTKSAGMELQQGARRRREPGTIATKLSSNVTKGFSRRAG